MQINIKSVLIFFLILGTLPATTPNAFAEQTQQTSPTISMTAKNIPLRDILHTISNKTGYQIEVNNDLLDIPVSGIFTDLSIVELMGRILKGKNAFILDDYQNKLLTIKLSTSQKGSSTLISEYNNFEGNTAYFKTQKKLQKLLDIKISDPNSGIQATPEISYQQLLGIQKELEQTIATPNSTVESSPGILYQETLVTQNKLDQKLSPKNSNEANNSNLLFHKTLRDQKELDTYIATNKDVEASPGVTYEDIIAIQANLDKQLNKN